MLKSSLNPKVSIIITNYMKERYLKKAVLSCAKQSYRNLEIIVVNDSPSFLKSLSIVKSLKDKRIRFFYTKRNYGHYACSNYAMDMSTGKYVTFLGADDYISEDHIPKLFKHLVENNLVAAHSLYNRVNCLGNIISGPNLCEASIFFEKERVLADVGYFHMVRCAADTEFRERIEKFYGERKVSVSKNCTYTALSLPGGLMRSKDLRPGSSARSNYVMQFRKFNKSAEKSNLFYNYNNKIVFKLHKEISITNFNTKSFREIKV